MKNPTLIISAAVCGCLCLVATVNAQNPKPFPPMKSGMNSGTENIGRSKGKLSGKDKTFMMNAAKGGMMEVEMGKVAAQNAKHPDVKKFGNRMVSEHSKANNELMALA